MLLPTMWLLTCKRLVRYNFCQSFSKHLHSIGVANIKWVYVLNTRSIFSFGVRTVSCTNTKMWDTLAPNTQCQNVLGPKCPYTTSTPVGELIQDSWSICYTCRGINCWRKLHLQGFFLHFRRFEVCLRVWRLHLSPVSGQFCRQLNTYLFHRACADMVV